MQSLRLIICFRLTLKFVGLRVLIIGGPILKDRTTLQLSRDR